MFEIIKLEFLLYDYISCRKIVYIMVYSITLRKIDVVQSENFQRELEQTVEANIEIFSCSKFTRGVLRY